MKENKLNTFKLKHRNREAITNRETEETEKKNRKHGKKCRNFQLTVHHGSAVESDILPTNSTNIEKINVSVIIIIIIIGRQQSV